MAREDSAPEVAPSSQPERRWAGASEGLQHTGIDGKEAQQPSSPKDYGTEKAEPLAGKHRSKWKALLAVGVVAAIVGLGAGVGIGYAAGNDQDNNVKALATTKFSTVTVTTTSVRIPKPSNTALTFTPQSTEVRQGLLGYSDIDCANKTVYHSKWGARFMEVCDVDMPGGSPVYGSTNGNTVQQIYYTVAYTFEQCMEACAQYNAQKDVLLDQSYSYSLNCRAVFYDSNLTSQFIGAGNQFLAGDQCGGHIANCYLKNARGITQGNGFMGVFASAYILD